MIDVQAEMVKFESLYEQSMAVLEPVLALFGVGYLEHVENHMGDVWTFDGLVLRDSSSKYQVLLGLHVDRWKAYGKYVLFVVQEGRVEPHVPFIEQWGVLLTADQEVSASEFLALKRAGGFWRE